MKQLKNMTVAELQAFAKENHILLDDATRKKDILDKIEAKINTDSSAQDAQPSTEKRVIGRVLKVAKPLIKGDDVKAVQNALIALKFHCGADGANGIYGATTAQAVRHFQSMNRLIVSGRVEKFTAQALGFTWQETPPAQE